MADPRPSDVKEWSDAELIARYRPAVTAIINAVYRQGMGGGLAITEAEGHLRDIEHELIDRLARWRRGE